MQGGAFVVIQIIATFDQHKLEHGTLRQIGRRVDNRSSTADLWGAPRSERVNRGDAGYTRLMATRRELRDAVLELPREERQALAEELYESLDEESDDAVWRDAWSDEIERRLEDIAGERVELIDAKAVHDELAAELRSLRK